MATSALTRPTAKAVVSGGLVAAAVLVAHLPSFFHRLLDGDEAIYGSIAALMNTGLPLYGEGGVDNKPPGIFWVYATAFRVFGMYQMTAVHAATLLAIGATCVLIFLIGWRISSIRAGVLAAVFYGVMTAAGNPRLLAANTEAFMMLPLTASVLVLLRRQWLWSGLLLAAAGAFRQSAAVDVLLLPLAVIYLEPRDSRLRASARFGAGLAAGLVVGGAALALTGSLSGFWHWTVGILGQYASTNWTPDQVWIRSKDSVIPFVLDMAVLWVAAIAWSLRWRRLDSAHRLIVGWLVVSLAGSLAGVHLSWHYFIQVMGPLALLSAFAIDAALRSRFRRQAAAIALVGVAAPALAWGTYDLVADPLTYDWSPPIAQHELVAAYIRDHTKPQDRVFVWGDWPALYVESDRLMASRFPGFLRGFARGSGRPPLNWDTTADVWPELQADLARNPPVLIVDTASAGWSDFSMYPMRNYPVLQNLVDTSYNHVITVDGVEIFALDGYFGIAGKPVGGVGTVTGRFTGTGSKGSPGILPAGGSTVGSTGDTTGSDPAGTAGTAGTAGFASTGLVTTGSADWMPPPVDPLRGSGETGLATITAAATTATITAAAACIPCSAAGAADLCAPSSSARAVSQPAIA